MGNEYAHFDGLSALARRAQTGEMDINQFYRSVESTMQPYLKKLARSIVGHAEAAEDIYHDAMARICTRIHKYDPKQPFSRWAIIITRNLALSERRKRIRSREYSMESLDASERKIVLRKAVTPEPQASEDEVLNTFETTIADLPERYRTLFHQHMTEGLKYSEIASRTGIPEGTLRSNFFVLRGILKERKAQVQKGLENIVLTN